MTRTPIPRKRGKPRRTLQVRNPEYLAYLREKGLCMVCPVDSVKAIADRWEKPCDACHTENGGASMKGPDSGCVPLCRQHHNQYDGRDRLPNGEFGKAAFERYYGIDMKAVAKKWYQAYQESKV